ncbi:hypothetical protein RAC89_24140 [Paenibacillus sp. GD4]|uniref:polysaccharide lyase n=1 Tax=Paenibacillus sp. GD4 TaxID=3068890 RepID=UPI00279669D1|nr:hypothetical protein [Paenibacillus sp. GD4]MDQ1913492.1 hypothetical protein [Paenibacillus sp. GD4]
MKSWFLTKKTLMPLALILALTTCLGIVSAAPSSVNVDFSRWNYGETYSQSMANTDFGAVNWLIGGSRLFVSGENDRHLRITYPPGQIGSQNSGGSFKAQLDPGTEYTAEYRVKFDSGFQWVKGGKLPGICGGECNTGGDVPDGKGFSTRMMWRANGELVAYVYHLDQSGTYGEDISTGFSAPAGSWVTIKLRVKLNTANNNNGILEVWINGTRKINRTNLRYMNDSTKKIDTFYFSTFYGGSTSDFAPSSTNYARFDNFSIQKVN